MSEQSKAKILPRHTGEQTCQTCRMQKDSLTSLMRYLLRVHHLTGTGWLIWNEEKTCGALFNHVLWLMSAALLLYFRWKITDALAKEEHLHQDLLTELVKVMWCHGVTYRWVHCFSALYKLFLLLFFVEKFFTFKRSKTNPDSVNYIWHESHDRPTYRPPAYLHTCPSVHTVHAFVSHGQGHPQA